MALDLAATKTHNNNCAYPQIGTIPVSTCYGDTDGTITMQHKDFYTPHAHVMNLHFTLMRLARIWAMEAGVGPIPQR